MSNRGPERVSNRAGCTEAGDTQAQICARLAMRNLWPSHARETPCPRRACRAINVRLHAPWRRAFPWGESNEARRARHRPGAAGDCWAMP